MVIRPLQGRIVEWDDGKGYGFIEVGKEKVFLHRREFAERHKRPEIGDLIRFSIGMDAQGRSCATKAAHVNDGGSITISAVLALMFLLVLPAMALQRRGVDLRFAGAYALGISGVSYLFYAADKRRAKREEWRIAESSLHLTELLGGWPGAFLAQRRLRHKCSKAGNQFIFWGIIIGYQFAAFDSLWDWKFSRMAAQYVVRGNSSR